MKIKKNGKVINLSESDVKKIVNKFKIQKFINEQNNGIVQTDYCKAADSKQSISGSNLISTMKCCIQKVGGGPEVMKCADAGNPISIGACLARVAGGKYKQINACYSKRTNAPTMS